jgi:hypothetical protein
MKHRTQKLTTVLLLALASGALRCSAETGTPTLSSDVGTDSEEFKLVAGEQLNAYAHALIERDALTLDALLSSEVKKRLASYEGGVERFMEKQRTTLLQAFPELETAGAVGAFEVTKVAAQEGVASATLAYQGTELPRPFHFVREGDRYLLNVARPGFSSPLGKGALANDTYLISASYDSEPATITCSYGGQVNVSPAQYIGTYNKYYVSCPNACGFWSGANFRSSGQWQGAANCDYNTWGTDVWVGWFGAHCNDAC